MTSDSTEQLERELQRSLAALTADEYEHHLADVPEPELSEFLRHVGTVVRPRFMSHGLGHHLVRLTPTIPVSEQVHLAGMLVQSALRKTSTLDASGQVPALARLRGALDHLCASLSPALVRVCVIAAAARSPDERTGALQLLESDSRLRLGGLSDSPHDPGQEDRESVRHLHALAHHGLGPPHALTNGTEAERLEVVRPWKASPAAGIGDDLFEEEGLFSGLDRILLQTAVATHAEVVGAPAPEELRRVVDEFVHLSAARPSSYFLLGFTSALDPEIPEPGDTAVDDERRRWYRLGRVSGHIRTGNRQQLVEECIEHRRQVAELVANPSMGNRIVGGVVRALMRSHAPVAAEILRARRRPFDGSLQLYRDVYGWARVLVVTERAAEAEALFVALEQLPLPDPDRRSGQQRRADLLRRRVTCKRSLGDFASAQMMLDTVDTDELDDRSLGAIHAERGLVAARAGHLRHIAFPRDEAEAEATAERLRSAQKHFETAIRYNPDDVRACYCLGVLAVIEGDQRRAAAILERAEAGLVWDPVLSRTGMLEATRFYRAAATLLTLEPGTDGPAVDVLVRALEGGFRPPSRVIVEIAEALVTYQSSHTGRFLHRAASSVRDLEPVAALVTELVAEGRQEIYEFARQLAGNPRVTFDRRFDLLETSVAQAGRQGDTEQQLQLVEEIDDLLSRACEPALDERWEVVLGSDEHLREILEPAEADMLRIGVLRRLGRFDNARGVATVLFYRSAQGGLERYDPADLLELIERMGAEDDELQRLRKVLPRTEHTPDEDAYSHLRRPVRVIFAGGNEIQARYQAELEERLGERYGPNLTLTWFNPGWAINWIKDAEGIEAELGDADAIVILTFMRTNLGRRLRRSASNRGVLWRSCTGQGKASMERAIINAVEGVLESDSADGQRARSSRT